MMDARNTAKAYGEWLVDWVPSEIVTKNDTFVIRSIRSRRIFATIPETNPTRIAMALLKTMRRLSANACPCCGSRNSSRAGSRLGETGRLVATAAVSADGSGVVGASLDDM